MEHLSRIKPSAVHQICHFSHLQYAYNLSKKTFKKNYITRVDLENLVQALKNVTLSEVGLEEEQVLSNNKVNESNESKQKIKIIKYLPICELDDLNIGIFCLPQGSEIPLHDHPRMIVLSRLLYGKLNIISYDILSSVEDVGKKDLKCKLAINEVYAGDKNCTYLTESERNIHAFKAITPCAILDVISPPYDPKTDRDCTYYDPIPSGEHGEVDMLRLNGIPKYYVIRGEYNGLPIKL